MSDVNTLLKFPETLEAIERGQLEAMRLGITEAYAVCNKCIEELEKIGWTAEVDLSGELFDLRKIED